MTIAQACERSDTADRAVIEAARALPMAHTEDERREAEARLERCRAERLAARVVLREAVNAALEAHRAAEASVIHRAALSGRPSCGVPQGRISTSGVGVTCPACLEREGRVRPALVADAFA